ncbi:MAG: DUF1161 domain-containing protein [Dokdonella sp.]|uniref:DUF1161 domain-containing protein n=1 Tax=Dokdonella sp. TaxID=2291710 RepID=UPI002C7B5A5A|nr:DUF1161 domain-containing protein [Dokdonella sp.]HOX71634.1 DUF1161 domain-containing protein [Dokdonella sp.]HPG93313.1 DUF1161 domain-containing protein [Dokdonella sp.]HPN80097.1 DUF1161 domain-containing protein [Dokdonella sp.]
MKAILALALIFPCIASAQTTTTRKPCDELKAEIAGKIERNGVRAYALEILDASAITDARIVGTCNGGQQRIAYRRGEPLAPATVRQVASSTE